MQIFDNSKYKRRPFCPLAKLETARGEEVWSGDLVRIRPASKSPTSERTFGLRLSGDWESALFLGLASPNQPEILKLKASRPDREIPTSDASLLVVAFFVEGKGPVFISRPSIRLLEFDLVKDNQSALVYCAEQEIVSLFPFETDPPAFDALVRSQGLAGLALRDFGSSARLLNPYYLPTTLASDDPPYFAARVRDLALLHKQVQTRKEKASAPVKIVISTKLGEEGEGGRGPFFEAETMKQAKDLVEEFVETFGVFLTVWKVENR